MGALTSCAYALLQGWSTIRSTRASGIAEAPTTQDARNGRLCRAQARGSASAQSSNCASGQQLITRSRGIRRAAHARARSPVHTALSRAHRYRLRTGTRRIASCASSKSSPDATDRHRARSRPPRARRRRNSAPIPRHPRARSIQRRAETENVHARSGPSRSFGVLVSRGAQRRCGAATTSPSARARFASCRRNVRADVGFMPFNKRKRRGLLVEAIDRMVLRGDAVHRQPTAIGRPYEWSVTVNACKRARCRFDVSPASARRRSQSECICRSQRSLLGRRARSGVRSAASAAARLRKFDRRPRRRRMSARLHLACMNHAIPIGEVPRAALEDHARGRGAICGISGACRQDQQRIDGTAGLRTAEAARL